MRRVVDDPDEEVGREERAEEHDLGRDEHEHPEDARDRRASWRSRPAGRGGRARVVRLGVGAHQATTAGSGSTSTCSTGRPVASRSRVTTSLRSQLERASPGKGRDDDLVDALVVDGLHGSRVRVGVRDLAVRVDARAAQRGQRAPQPALGLGVIVPSPDRSAGR